MVFDNRLVVQGVREDDLTYQFGKMLRERTESFYREYKHQKELTDLENRLYERIMKKLTVEVNNEASPVIADLRKEIEKMLKVGQ